MGCPLCCPRCGVEMNAKNEELVCPHCSYISGVDEIPSLGDPKALYEWAKKWYPQNFKHIKDT